jgi:hypothetical protein
LGRAGYYRRFIKDYAAVAKPWTDIVGKDEDRVMEKAPVVATPAMAASYQKLKQALLTSPVLAYPQFESQEPFILDTDWSGAANKIGGVLSQKQAGGEKVIVNRAQKISRSQKDCAYKRRTVGHCTFLPLLALLSTALPSPIHNQNRPSIAPVHGRHGASLGNEKRWLDTLSNFNFLMEHAQARQETCKC